MDTTELAQLVLRYRARHKISQEEFAKLVEMNVTTIHNIENEKHIPWLRTERAILDFLEDEKKHGRYDFPSN